MVNSDNLYHRIVEAAHEGMLVIDKSARVMFANQSIARLLGYETEEMLGRSALEFIFDKDQELVMRRLEEREADESRPLDLRFRRKDGSYVYASVTTSALSDEEGNFTGMLALSREVDDHRKAEEGLQPSQAELRLVADNAPVFIAHCDKEQRFKFVNEGYATRLGLRPADLIGKAIWDVLGVKAYEAFRQYIDAALSGQKVEFEIEVPYEQIGSRIMHCSYAPELDENGKAQGWVAVLTDVTDRKQAEEALRQSEERFAKAFEASPLALTITSLKTGRLLEVNETFVHLSGYTREEAIGRTTLELGLWTMPTDREAELAMVMERGQVRNVEYRFRMKDGSELVGLLSAEKIEIGREPCALTVIEDITERKRAEAARSDLLRREQEARREAEAANQMKDEFLATLSHELRTPLNAIIGWSEMLSRKRVDPSLTSHALEVINRNAKSQARLIEDLLDVSRVITGKLQLDSRPIELAPVIEAAIDAIRPKAEAKAIAIHKSLEPSNLIVTGDATRLQQVVWNLLSNAVKFTPEGGRITVELRRSGTDAEIRVIDTGEGISEEFLPHVFDRFRQADSSYTRRHSGLGLGLAIASHLVESHRGTIEAYSLGEGQGSAFTVRIPLAVRQYEDHAGNERGNLERHGIDDAFDALTGISVLVVDDDSDTREMLATVLQMYGAKVKECGTARECLDEMKSWRPDLLISDIGMPDEDGYSLIKKVRSFVAEQGGNAPAIALTGYASPEEGQRLLSAGYQLHLAKPTDPAALIDAILRLVGRDGKGKSV